MCKHTTYRGGYMNDSTWIKEVTYKKYPKVEKELYTDILIIGAGLTGLSLAYYVSNTTSDVIIVESDIIGTGASGRNTCKISVQQETIYQELIKKHGYEKAKLYYQSQVEAIDSIEAIVKEYQIECDFMRCDSYIFTQTEQNLAKLQDEYQACIDLNIPVSYVHEWEFPIPFIEGIKCTNQAKFQPVKYMIGLGDVLTKRNIAIYEHSPVKTILEKDNEYIALINNCKIHAKRIVQATQFPFYDLHQFMFSRVHPSMNSLASTKLSIELPHAMLINIDEPLQSYNTINQTFVVGGNEHRVGVAIHHPDAFLHEAQKTFHIESFDNIWTSQDYQSFDHLPMIGKLQSSNSAIYIATAYQKWGNTNSNVAAKLLCAYLLQEDSQYMELFNPHRITSLFVLDFVKENLDIAYQFIKSKFKDPDESYPLIGEGKIIMIDQHPFGVYHDEQDEIFIIDVTCPHLGCTCVFNHIDKTWDCPCHASRYTYKGEVIKGPSTHKLNTYGEGLNPIDPHIL